jgi:hypothetical protein
MNSSAAGLWPSNPIVPLTPLTSCFSRLQAWTPRRSAGGAWNSHKSSKADLSMGFVSSEEDDPSLKKNLDLVDALVNVVEPETAGDPMSEQKWTRSSLSHITQRLEAEGHAVSAPTVGALLLMLGYSMKVNQKRLEGDSHPERDLQFNLIQAHRDAFTAAGLPVISVDTKKKELIGDFKNAGQSWTQKPTEVNLHDFPQDALGRAVPYGIYDLNRKQGAVYIGASADTSEFAVDCIHTWWRTLGQVAYPHAKEILLLADGGGSNNCRYSLWRQQLQEKLSEGCGLKVTLCHYPPGCSKWNPIEHRLFGPISINWAGEPLRTFETMLRFIRGTTNKAGLSVQAFLNHQVYETGIKIAKEVLENINIIRHSVCPLWNYSILPSGLSLSDFPATANIGKLLF